jgi:hypothetical protein
MLASQHGLLAEVMPLDSIDNLNPVTNSASIPTRSAVVPVASWPARPPPVVLGVGQPATNRDWSFVVDQVSIAPDPTENGWSRANVALRFVNIGSRAARLDIPTSVTGSSPASQPRDAGPSVLPLPAVPAKPSAQVDGLRLVLRDASGREFGGGFGSDLSSYDLIAAPGDMLRLPFSFRYPSSSTGPFVLRLVFPNPANAGSFDVHLDAQASDAANFPGSAPTTELSSGSWETIDAQWAISSPGVDFGTGRGPGERPVTLNLKVKNLTDTARPALIDRDDQNGMARDFYLTDVQGNLAYSHVDTQPSVIVPPHETRDVSVQLFTTDLATSAHPLTFTAILNWRTNCYVRFQIH